MITVSRYIGREGIVVDRDVRGKWQSAFAAGETHCEQLGALALLQHGIWAFKVSGAGERTDLVFGEALVDSTEPARASEALVLTEWKRVTPIDSSQKATGAVEQAELYSGGILGGFELRDRRFVILVSQKQLALPPDVGRGGRIYRHVNIAVDPDTPSVAAKHVRAE
jgi:hypothetical protein